jgi:hypothetical protein
VGVLGGAGEVYMLVYLRKIDGCISSRKLLRKSCKRATIERLSDGISLETLKKLSEVPNVSIRQPARGILTNRDLKTECRRFLIQLCYAENEENVLKACTV